MSSEISSLYQDIRSNLEASRKALITTSILGDEESPGVRSIEEGSIVLNTLEAIALEVRNLLDLHPSLESLFEKTFGKVRELFEPTVLVETALLDDFLFPTTNTYSILVDGQFSPELTESYKDIFKAWVEEKTLKHINTQEVVKNQFDLKLNDRDLSCQCVQCLGDYRTQVREAVYALQSGLIDKTEERLHEWVLTKKISDISGAVFNLKRDLEKNFQNEG